MPAISPFMTSESSCAGPHHPPVARFARSPIVRGLFLTAFLLGVTSLVSASEPRILINPTANPVLATQMHKGLFLTTAHIDQREVGPFLLDTGAPWVVLDATLVKTLFPDSRGTDAATLPAGRPGVVTTLEVGPLILQQIEIAFLDLSAPSTPFGRRLAGILGYPFFARAVVEVNYAQGTVACFDPRTYRLPRGKWVPLALQDHRPVLPARVDGIVGHFILDTGSTHTARLYPAFVQTHRLGEHRSTTPRREMGVEGLHEIAMARIAQFELAGVRFLQPMVTFARPDDAGPPEIAGVIGAGFLRAFTVVFDYPELAIALLPNLPRR